MVEFDDLPFVNVLKLLDDYAKDFKKTLKSTLESNGRKASGQLINNIETRVKIGNLVYEVNLEAADYLYWVDNGRKKGKFPPIDKILEWIRVKPIVPREDENGRVPTEQQLAFLIGRKIANEGYEGSNDFKSTQADVNAYYIPRLQEALEKDFQEYHSIKIKEELDEILKVAFLF